MVPPNFPGRLLVQVMISMQSTLPVSGTEAGARNLLSNCVGLRAGDALLLVAEDPALGYFGPGLVETIAAHARQIGAAVRVIDAPVIEDPSDFPKDVQDAISESDHTVFLARLGDQVRFQLMPGSGSKSMCYALDTDYLAAPFACLDHRIMVALKQKLESAFDAANGWRVTCPLGSDISGRFPPPAEDPTEGEVTMRRFPMLTYRPIPASSMTGRVALSRWLIGTGSRLYEPFGLQFDGTVFAHVENGRIAGFEGAVDTVGRIRDHYDFVADRYRIDRDVVDSFHTGMNPQTFYSGRAESNFPRWGGVAFGAPHYLHFHTCGNYSPGEICWSVFDPTIVVDGEAFWENGIFRFVDRPEVQALFSTHPDVAAAFAQPRRDIGV
jgi:hypothetical protein